jgi:hypothetical protein
MVFTVPYSYMYINHIHLLLPSSFTFSLPLKPSPCGSPGMVHTNVIPALERLKEDHKLEASLGYK